MNDYDLVLMICEGRQATAGHSKSVEELSFPGISGFDPEKPESSSSEALIS